MNLLSRLKIRTKLASIVVLASLTICAIIALAASLSENRMLADRTAQMRSATDLLYGMAETLQDEVTAGKMTIAEAKEEFRRRGRKMTFDGGQGYPNVYNADKSMLLNTANPARTPTVSRSLTSRSTPPGGVRKAAPPPSSIIAPAKKFPSEKWSMPAASILGTW
jgi:methyl-accepting chemotaxis protein